MESKEAVKNEKVKDKEAEIKEELKDDKKDSGYNWKCFNLFYF